MDVVLNPAYREAHGADARYRIILGGAGSGKSHFLAQETILSMLENSGYHYLIVRKTNRSIRHSVFGLLVGLISEYGLSDYFQVSKSDMTIICKTGSTLFSSGLDDVEKLKSIAGINRIWVEEATETTEQDFNQLDLRLRGKNDLGYCITLTFNPISERHWIKRRFFDREDKKAYILRTTYKDNAFLDDEYREQLEKLIDLDMNYYRVYAQGEWGKVGNLIFRNWKAEDIPNEEKAKFDTFQHGCDFGFSTDPFAYICSHYDSKRKRLYILEAIGATDLSNEESADMVRPYVGRDRLICDSAEPKSISEFRKLGINAYGADKGKGSIENGIRFLQSLEIVIDSHCQNVINEFASYSWKEDKSGQALAIPVDKNNHWLDALRYSLEDVNIETGISFLK